MGMFRHSFALTPAVAGAPKAAPIPAAAAPAAAPFDGVRS
jgi:hypothetical protein